MRAVTGIVFDKDGTLFDFATTWEAWASAFLLRLCTGNRTQAAEIGKVIGFDLVRRKFAPSSVVIAGTPGEVGAALHPYFPQMTMGALLEILNHEAESAPQAAAVPLAPLLGELRTQGLRLGVATNDAEKPARAHLEQAGITGFFDFIAGYDSGYGGKPAPGQLLAFATQTGLDPSEVLMVGDSTHDLRAGRAAGMIPVGVLTGLASQEDLSSFAEVVLPNIGHLPSWLATRSRSQADD
ncbi:HAD family hydrolase [Sulfitobacter sp. F26204]|uniref:HAD family hydrolase n=1 Tax=Sulfitobacter sp. F26204 TaxID=2996014 RepID=UPI00225E3197|nr:HAD family hydrolase [Sulfitobacter sp. F26204]MCX7559215.1 HAD family hydrolase [Sulfitobacter sp. F26204]